MANDGTAMLMTPEELGRRLDDPDVIVVDCRFNLMQPEAGASAYRAGHIPGAFYAHLDRDLAAPRTATSGRHPLPDVRTLCDLFSSWGIGRDSLVIAYDDAGGAIAARLWWLLRWLGHRATGLLDGGLPAWQATGLPLTTAVPADRHGAFKGEPGQMPTIEADEIEALLQAATFRLIDVRAQRRFLGLEEPIDPVAGHVPGAINLPFQDSLRDDGRFRSREALHARFHPVIADRSGHDVAVMCGSGVTACHGIFALELAGLPGARLYPGSWSEWLSPGTRAVARS